MIIKKIVWALALASVSPLTLAQTPMAACAASERYEFDLADEVQGLAVKMRLLHDGHWLAFDPALLQGKRHFTIEVRPEPTLHPIDFSLKIGQERLSDGDGAWAKSSDTP